jgi:valyl-tRNA synthetase
LHITHDTNVNSSSRRSEQRTPGTCLETTKVEKDIATIDKKLAAPSFAEKAPAQVVAEARERRGALAGKLGKLREALGIGEELG